MASTEKVSLTLDTGALVLARRAAAIEGMSLSRFVSRLLHQHAFDSQPAPTNADLARDERDAEQDLRELVAAEDDEQR